MTLSIHPAKARPKTAAVVAFALGILLQTLWQWLSPTITVILWGVLVYSLRDFFLPTTYIFQEENLTVEGPLKLKKSYAWRRFRTYIKDRNGLFLSPYKSKRSSEGYRGLFLPLDRESRERAEQYCAQLGLEKRRK